MDQVKFIGLVRSALKDLKDCPLQETENAPPATIEVHDEFLEGMKSLKPGAELIIMTWLHKADRSVLLTQPRNIVTAPMIGVFATRSPDRPNPIGLHHAKVISVVKNKIQVDHLEVLDQTPVIDIKPDFS